MSTERKAWACTCGKTHAPHVDTCPGASGGVVVVEGVLSPDRYKALSEAIANGMQPPSTPAMHRQGGRVHVR